MNIEAEKARAESRALCRKLRSKNDPICDEAAAALEGTFDAFNGIVESMKKLRERCKNAERNHSDLLTLWDRVPDEHRLYAVHGKAA